MSMNLNTPITISTILRNILCQMGKRLASMIQNILTMIFMIPNHIHCPMVKRLVKMILVTHFTSSLLLQSTPCLMERQFQLMTQNILVTTYRNHRSLMVNQ